MVNSQYHLPVDCGVAVESDKKFVPAELTVAVRLPLDSVISAWVLLGSNVVYAIIAP